MEGSFKKLHDLALRVNTETETRVYLNNFDGAYNLQIISPGIGRDRETVYSIKKSADSEAEAKEQYQKAVRHMQAVLNGRAEERTSFPDSM